MTPEPPPVNPETLIPSEPLPATSSPPRPWSFRDLALLLGLGVAALILAYAIVIISFLALSPLTGWHVPPRTIQENAYLSLMIQTVFYVFLFGALYFLVASSKRLPFWGAMKWRGPDFGRASGYVIIGVVLSIGVELAPAIFPDQADFPLRDFFATPALSYAVGAFAILVAPLMEELIFRGVLFSVFEDQIGKVFAVFSTAALFAGMHIPEYRGAWNHVFLLFIVGLVFSLARGVTGSIAPSVILHTAYNLTQLVILFIATDHFRTFPGLLLC
jgi:membrane protease YdiL (CAAX protease family)